MARVCKRMFTEIPDTVSTLLAVAKWLKEQADSRYRPRSTEWHSREYVDMSCLIDEANGWITAAEDARVTADEGLTARAGPLCKGEATAEGPDARAGPSSKGRKDDGALDGFCQLRNKAAEGEVEQERQREQEEERKMEECRQKGFRREECWQQTRVRAADRQRAEELRAERQRRSADKREAKTKKAAERRIVLEP